MTYFEELQQALGQIDASALFEFVEHSPGTIWIAGNGGSAAIAQHWACDLSKAAGRRAIALGSNPALLTAYANDLGYDQMLVNELRQYARRGDILICLSCSGTSPNIVAATAYAASQRIPSVLITGDHLNGAAFAVIRIPSQSYGILEDCFSAIGHWLTEALCSQ